MHPLATLHLSLRAVLLSLVFLAAPAGAQATFDSGLLGTWVGTGPNEGAAVVVSRNHIILDGERMSLRVVSATVLAIGDGDEEETVRYRRNGDELQIVDSSETTTWRRVGKRSPEKRVSPAPASKTGNPLDGGGGNPLDAPARDPFARKFRGKGVILELRGDVALRYRGTLTFRGKAYPALGRARGNQFRGYFRSGDRDFPFEAVVDGDRMTLKSGKSEYQLVAAPAHNPLDPTPGPKAGKPNAGWKSLVDMPSGVGCRMPKDWTVTQSTKDVCVINPGFRRGQTLEVSISLHCLPLEAEARTLSPEALLASELASTRKALLDSGGLRTGDPVGGVQKFTVRGQPAAFVEMPVETKTGQRGLVWFALRVAGDKCLACNSVYLNGKDKDYLPKVKAVFDSLTPAADVRSPLFRDEVDTSTDTGGGAGRSQAK